jgi:hypothetical protein
MPVLITNGTAERTSRPSKTALLARFDAKLPHGGNTQSWSSGHDDYKANFWKRSAHDASFRIVRRLQSPLQQ